MQKTYQAVLAVPFGQVAVSACDGVVVELDFCKPDQHALRQDQALAPLSNFIAAYFRGESHPLPPFLAQGTAFQQRVWQALLDIPFGQQCTYGELAQQLGSHARAVGQACRRNPIPLLIPCHRVLARDHLGGFGGAREGEPMDIKRFLLAHEGMVFDPQPHQQDLLAL